MLCTLFYVIVDSPLGYLSVEHTHTHKKKDIFHRPIKQGFLKQTFFKPLAVVIVRTGTKTVLGLY